MRPIYGVSSKYDFGRWDHVVYVFEDRELAEKWLYTEEYDFLEDLRNTMNMFQAEMGKKYNIFVRTIQNWDNGRCPYEGYSALFNEIELASWAPIRSSERLGASRHSAILFPVYPKRRCHGG